MKYVHSCIAALALLASSAVAFAAPAAAQDRAPQLSPGGARVIKEFSERGGPTAFRVKDVEIRGREIKLIPVGHGTDARVNLRPVVAFRNPSGRYSLLGDNEPPMIGNGALLRMLQAHARETSAEDWLKVTGSGTPTDPDGYELATQHVLSLLEKLPAISDVSSQMAALRDISRFGDPIYGNATKSLDTWKDDLGHCAAASLALMLSVARGKHYIPFQYGSATNPTLNHLFIATTPQMVRVFRANGVKATHAGKGLKTLDQVEGVLGNEAYKPGQLVFLGMGGSMGHAVVGVKLGDGKWYVVNNQSWYTSHHPTVNVPPGKLQSIEEWYASYMAIDPGATWDVVGTDLKIPFASSDSR
jgi:hypothetical protein